MNKQLDNWMKLDALYDKHEEASQLVAAIPELAQYTEEEYQQAVDEKEKAWLAIEKEVARQYS